MLLAPPVQGMCFIKLLMLVTPLPMQSFPCNPCNITFLVHIHHHLLKSQVVGCPACLINRKRRVWPEERGPCGKNCAPLGLGEGRSQTTGPLGHGENTKFALNMMESIRRFEQRMICTDYQIEKVILASEYGLDSMGSKVEPTFPRKTRFSLQTTHFLFAATRDSHDAGGSGFILFLLRLFQLGNQVNSQKGQQEENESNKRSHKRL